MSTPPPSRHHVGGLLAKLISERKHRAIKHGAIITRQVDQTGLRNQAAKLDQMPRAFAPVHDPFPSVRPGTIRFKPPADRTRTRSVAQALMDSLGSGRSRDVGLSL